MAILIIMTYIRHKSHDNQYRMDKLNTVQKHCIHEFDRLKKQHRKLSHKIKEYEQRRNQSNNQHGDPGGI